MSLTAAGMIGLTGVNAAGLGVCVNTLPMLNHSRAGLPVAFVMRGVLERTTAAGAAAFLETVPHASGQHYALAAADGVMGYECSAAGAVRSDDGSGGLRHTNHPLRSGDLDPARADEETPDSHTRLRALESAAPDADGGRLRAGPGRPRRPALRHPRARPALDHVRVDLGRARYAGAGADRTGPARPHRLADAAPSVWTPPLAPDALERGPQQARDVHLRDPQPLGDLGLRQLEPEPQRDDDLRAV